MRARHNLPQGATEAICGPRPAPRSQQTLLFLEPLLRFENRLVLAAALVELQPSALPMDISARGPTSGDAGVSVWERESHRRGTDGSVGEEIRKGSARDQISARQCHFARLDPSLILSMGAPLHITWFLLHSTLKKGRRCLQDDFALTFLPVTSDAAGTFFALV